MGRARRRPRAGTAVPQPHLGRRPRSGEIREADSAQPRAQPGGPLRPRNPKHRAGDPSADIASPHALALQPRRVPGPRLSRPRRHGAEARPRPTPVKTLGDGADTGPPRPDAEVARLPLNPRPHPAPRLTQSDSGPQAGALRSPVRGGWRDLRRWTSWAPGTPVLPRGSGRLRSAREGADPT